MAYEFTKLSEVPALSEVPENATVLAEVNGTIRRIPGDGLGGGKTLIITSSDFSVSGAYTYASAEPTVTYSANMTLKDAMSAFYNGELQGAVLHCVINGMNAFVGSEIVADGSSNYGTDCLAIAFYNGIELFLTSDGISTTEPVGG